MAILRWSGPGFYLCVSEGDYSERVYFKVADEYNHEIQEHYPFPFFSTPFYVENTDTFYFSPSLCEPDEFIVEPFTRIERETLRKEGVLLE